MRAGIEVARGDDLRYGNDDQRGTEVTIGGVSPVPGGTLGEDRTKPLGLPEWDSRQRLDAATRTMTIGQLLRDTSFALSAGEARVARGAALGLEGTWTADDRRTVEIRLEATLEVPCGGDQPTRAGRDGRGTGRR